MLESISGYPILVSREQLLQPKCVHVVLSLHSSPSSACDGISKWFDGSDGADGASSNSIGKKKTSTVNQPVDIWSGSSPQTKSYSFPATSDSQTSSSRASCSSPKAWPEKAQDTGRCLFLGSLRFEKKKQHIILAWKQYFFDAENKKRILKKVSTSPMAPSLCQIHRWEVQTLFWWFNGCLRSTFREKIIE